MQPNCKSAQGVVCAWGASRKRGVPVSHLAFLETFVKQSSACRVTALEMEVKGFPGTGSPSRATPRRRGWRPPCGFCDGLAFFGLRGENLYFQQGRGDIKVGAKSALPARGDRCTH